MPAGTPGWGGQLDWAPGEAQVWRLGRATECRLASDWGGAGGRRWGGGDRRKGFQTGGGVNPPAGRVSGVVVVHRVGRLVGVAVQQGGADGLAVLVHQLLIEIYRIAVVAGVVGVPLGLSAHGNAVLGLVGVLVGHGGNDHVVGLSVDAGGIGAVDGHMELVVFVQIGLNLDGVIGVILEAEVQLVAPHGGVGADDGHIAAVELVLVALHNLQIGLEGNPVEVGRELADAAGGGVHALAVLVGAGGLVAAGQGVGAHRVVIGEGLSGEQDGAVEPLGRQIDVVPAVGGAGAGGGTAAQHILEKIGLQLGGGQLRLGEKQGDGHRLSLPGRIQHSLGLGRVEVHSGDRGDDLTRLLV